MSRFVLFSGPTGLGFTLDEQISETDIEKMLSFNDEEIDEILHTHSSNQAYWEAFALRLKKKLDEFRDNWAKKWWAHNKRFAKDVLTAYGETKPTIDAITDMVINIYGKEITQVQRDQYANSAYAVASKRASCTDSVEEYRTSMFKYLAGENPWYYEDLVTTQNNLEENYEVVRIVAERLNAKSFHVKEVLALIQSNFGNTGNFNTPRNERDLMRRVGREKEV